MMSLRDSPLEPKGAGGRATSRLNAALQWPTTVSETQREIKFERKAAALCFRACLQTG